MSEPRKKSRWPITIAAFLATAGVIATAIWGPGAKKNGGIDPVSPVAAQVSKDTAGSLAATSTTSRVANPSTGAATTSTNNAASSTSTATNISAAPAATALPTQKFTARLPAGTTAPTTPAMLGSLDSAKYKYQIQFSPISAGFSRIIFSDFWMPARLNLGRFNNEISKALRAPRS